MTDTTNSTADGQPSNPAGGQTNADGGNAGGTGAPNAGTTITGDSPAGAPAADGTAAKPGDKPADGADGKNADGTAKAGDEPTVPESYDFKLPEGMTLDQAAADQFTTIAKDLKLPADAAQKLVDLYATQLQAQAQVHAETVKGWVTEMTADKEYGGDKLQETTAAARKTMDAFGTPALKDYLNATGLGNHPELVKVFARVGKALSEDTFVKGGSTAGADKPLANRMFPTMN